jgi:hypothetical protein
MVGRFVYRLVIVVTIFAFALQGCKGQNFVADKELMPYVHEYMQFLKQERIGAQFQTKFVVAFNPFLDSFRFAGYAEGMNKDKEVNVYVSRMVWNRSNEGQKRWLIFHELSHDLFNLKHGTCELMKPQLSLKDNMETFNIAKKELAKVLKNR